MMVLVKGGMLSSCSCPPSLRLAAYVITATRGDGNVKSVTEAFTSIGSIANTLTQCVEEVFWVGRRCLRCSMCYPGHVATGTYL